MDVIKLSLDKENILEFNIDIQGYAHTVITKAPKVRMILKQKAMGFCVDATKLDKTYSVVIPEMKNIMEYGMCDARMEIIIDNKYFVPWESQIEFDDNLKVKASPVIKEKKKTFNIKNGNNKLKTATFDGAITDIMEHSRAAIDIIGDLGTGNKEKNILNYESKEEEDLQFIDDTKLNRKY